MSVIKKIALSNSQVFNIVVWYNNDFKAKERNKVLPIKLQLDLQRNIANLIESARSYEKLCKTLIADIQEEYSTDEKSNKVKEIQKDENGDEKEIFNHTVKPEYLKEYNQKINEAKEKIAELSKEGEVYSLRIFDLDAFTDSLPQDTILTVDDLYTLAFMDENNDKIVEE